MNTTMFIIAAAFFATFSVSHAEPLREVQFQLSIEKGTLASVLEQLSHQTSLQIGTQANVTNSRVTTLGPFAARAKVDEALRQLLQGTDLSYAWRNEDTIRVFAISGQRTNWESAVITAQEASDTLRILAGLHYETGSCGHLTVGPFRSTEPITGEAFWGELIKPYCPVIRMPRGDIEPSSIDHETIEGQTQHHFAIEEMPRLFALQRISQQSRVSVRYESSDADEELAPIGPILGPMALNEALTRAVRGSELRIRWADHDTVSIEPTYTMVTYADMSKCVCNFGLPEWRPLESRHVTVTAPRLPALAQYSAVPVASFDRSYIEATGAATIPELLNYLAQQAFNPQRGYRASAAQYFEGRGFGAQYSLILIDGHRAYGSAGDPMTHAFDLNIVPLSAVERIEVAMDQPSALYGTDAIGGTVNIVLRRSLQKGAAISWGSARGGAEKKQAVLLADGQWESMKAGFVLDYLARGDLLGSQRDRWRNQDYTRYATGVDYRMPFGAPPNVHAVSGNLPGTDANSAALILEPGGLAIQPNLLRMESALAHAAIVPEQKRANLYGFMNAAMGSAELRLGILFGQQTVSLRLFPVDVPGLIWGAQHAQNPFDVDVVIETLLTGLPRRTREAESWIARLMSELSGSVGPWRFSAFLVAQQDRSRTWLSNEIDPSVLAESLRTENPTAGLNVLSDRPGEGGLPSGLILPPQVDTYVTGAVQVGYSLSGSLGRLPAGEVDTVVGVEHREETVCFDAHVGALKREITSIFSHARIPILSASSRSGSSALGDLDLNLGARRDFHSDVHDVTTWQYGIAWRPVRALKIHAGYSNLFRPPSLAELYLPRFSFPTEVFDPLRDEVAAVRFITGGNPSLQPTEGQSLNVGMSIESNHWSASLNYWDTRMRNRVSAVLVQDLIHAQTDVQGRIIRASSTRLADGTPNIPGRILALDTTRANFGAIAARGFDVSLQREFKTSTMRITPQIDISRTVDFRYRDLPAASAPLLDRAGVASPYGTVPSGRAVASLIFDLDQTRASAMARYHTSYKDYSTIEGAPTDRRVPGQTLLDIKISRDIGEHLTLSVGANNLLDNLPPFALAGGWEGFDQSQGDLVGREVYLEITGTL